MKKKICGLFGILLVTILTITNVYALEITQAGDNVIQEGDYDSVRLVAGNKVTNKANVDGISLVAGNEVILEGSAPYGFYAGNIVTVNENISKDMFVAGNNITIGEYAVIGRDVYIMGNTIKINTNVSRDLRIGGESVNLSGITIGGDAYIAAEEIILDENTVITGKLTYPEKAKITGLDSATIGSVETKKYDEAVIEYNFIDSVYDFIVSAVAAFIVIVALFFVIPNSKEKLNKVELKISSIAKITGIGLLVLIVMPIISLFALFTGFLTPLALIAFAIYIISIYLSSLLVYYIIGNVFTNKVFKKDNTYLALACGIVLTKLVKLIPVIGGLISAIVLFYGLGLIYKYIQARQK